MVELKRAQREMLSEKLSDAGNLAAGALVFGQSLAERPFSIVMALFGLLTAIADHERRRERGPDLNVAERHVPTH
jgi:hypothetical protein